MKVKRVSKKSSPTEWFWVTESNDIKEYELLNFNLCGVEKFRKTGKKVTVDQTLELSIFIGKKIIGIGMNFPREIGEKTDPEFFFRKPSSLARSQKLFLDYTNLFWGEPEIAVILCLVNDQIEILGYSLANDITRKGLDLHNHDEQAKGVESTLVLSEWMETSFTLIDQQINGFQNNQLHRSGNVSEMVLKISDVIAMTRNKLEVSNFDLVILGTPRRCGEMLFIHKGCDYKVSVDGLGEMTTYFL
jgi:2-keto-4-pentenoate hydratase/2-oxohepta-3-ene-1,7-dioic acid hydratase in catechol pathway